MFKTAQTICGMGVQAPSADSWVLIFVCASGAPSYCETKNVPGASRDTEICARPDSIVTTSNIFAIAGATSGDFEAECPLEDTLEGTARDRY